MEYVVVLISRTFKSKITYFTDNLTKQVLLTTAKAIINILHLKVHSIGIIYAMKPFKFMM